MGPKNWCAVLAIVGVGLVTPACAGQDEKAATDAAMKETGGDAGSLAATRQYAADGAAAGSPTAGAPATVVVAPRDLVYTADLRVVARSVPVATSKVEALASARGGFVFGQESQSGAAGDAMLTLKVPAPNFRALLADLARLGKEASRSVRTEDVTDAGVDLDARILSAQRSVERVRSFLDEAKNVGELSGVEAELTRRETELEQLTAQRRALDDRVALATIELTLTERPAPVVAASPGDPLRGVPGFGEALGTGVDWLVRALRVAGAALGYSLPFLIVAAVPLLGRRWLRRRRGPDLASAA